MCAHTVPPPHSESLAQRVFFIPDLVDVIFNFLDRKANVTNALVCKQWSPIALDVVWKEVDDLVQLFSLLKPIREATRSEEEYEYVSHLESYYSHCSCNPRYVGLRGDAGRQRLAQIRTIRLPCPVFALPLGHVHI
jgi:hypothetical protein